MIFNNAIPDGVVTLFLQLTISESDFFNYWIGDNFYRTFVCSVLSIYLSIYRNYGNFNYVVFLSSIKTDHLIENNKICLSCKMT